MPSEEQSDKPITPLPALTTANSPKKSLPNDIPMVMEFLNKHGVSLSQGQALYAWPQQLIEELSAVQGFLRDDDKAFEESFLEFCEKRTAVGLVDGGFVLFSPLLSPQPPTDDKLKALGLDTQLPGPQVRLDLEIAKRRTDPYRDQGLAFLGWLLTQPEYQKDLQEIRRHRDLQLSGWSFCFADGRPDQRLRDFLDKWQLSSMASWDLPIPQGPNLSGAPWPNAVTEGKSMTRMDIPNTMNVASRNQISEIAKEIAARDSPAHLKEWVQIQQHKKRGVRPAHYSQLFNVHFYRMLALRRYAEKIVGKVQAVDEAVGRFISIGDDQVKRLRTELERCWPDEPAKFSKPATQALAPNMVIQLLPSQDGEQSVPS